MSLSLSQVVHVSRPGMWGASVICYAFALEEAPPLTSLPFWAGLAYVTLPFNALIMGWNDIMDWDVDQLNPRKGTGVWGARLSQAQLSRLPAWIAALQLPFVAALLWWAPLPRALAVMANVLLASFVYNTPPLQISRVPVADLAGNVWIWLGATHVAAAANGVDASPWRCLLLTLCLVRSQLRGALCDLAADRRARKATIATLAGKRATVALIQLVWFAEGALVYWHFRERALAAVYLVVGLGMVAGAVRISHMYQLTTWMLGYMLVSQWVEL